MKNKQSNKKNSIIIIPKSLQSPITFYIIWGLSCMFYFYESLLQVAPSVMTNELTHDFLINGNTLGILSGIYFYSYAFMQLPIGLLMDYFSPQYLLILASIFCSSSAIIFSITNNFIMACISRLILGCSSAFAIIGSMKLINHYFSSKYFSFLTGIMVTFGMLGSIIGEAPLSVLIKYYGWRKSIFFIGIFGLILPFLMTVFSNKKIKKNNLFNSNKSLISKDIMNNICTMLKNPQLWLIALYGGFMYMPTPIFCGLWGVPFLMEKINLNKIIAANYVSLIFVGWAIGSPLWGLYSNWIGKCKPIMYISSFGALFTNSLFIYCNIHLHWILQLLLFSFGFFSSGFFSSFTLGKTLYNKQNFATSLSFINTINMLGIALIQPIIGLILDKMCYKHYIIYNNNIIILYPIQAYYVALTLLPISIIISLIILTKIKENY
ncbi:MFS transporter [Candidatus Legionella polyplacis]|uniref:Lysosomal dipeptide transporter MFSD1 n=1 Tax=Candidatus Legionella polyplacis TaxID=2005262 RepID=A0ABZ2GVV1_9GAMM